jgi:hypothetical protein
MSELRAAARRIRITPADWKGVPLQGYNEDEVVASTRTKSDLYARVLVMECDGARALIVTLDSCMAHETIFHALHGDGTLRQVSPALKAGTRTAWAEAAGCAPGAVFVSATHTHTAPVRLGNGEEKIYDAIIASIREAADPRHLEPATLAVRVKTDPDFTNAVTGVPGLARLRRPSLEPWEPKDAAYAIDDTMTVVRIGRTAEGAAPIAVLANYGIHPTLNEKNDRMSPDFVGDAMQKVEAASKDTVAFFLQGCCGDVGPVFKQGNDCRIEELAGYLCNHTVGALAAGMTDLKPTAPVGLTRSFRPTTRPGYGEKPEVVVSGVRIAREAVLLGVSAELFSSYRERIAARAISEAERDGGRIEHAVVCGLVNGYAGYLPAAEDFGPGGKHDVREQGGGVTYEMNSTPYTPSIEPELMNAVDAVLKALA